MLISVQIHRRRFRLTRRWYRFLIGLNRRNRGRIGAMSFYGSNLPSMRGPGVVVHTRTDFLNFLTSSPESE